MVVVLCCLLQIMVLQCIVSYDYECSEMTELEVGVKSQLVEVFQAAWVVW